MPEMYLRQPGVTDSACRSFTRNKEIHDLFIKTNLMTCFLHDMAYGDSKDLPRKTASDKLLRNKAFNIAKNLKYDGYERGFALIVYEFFDQKPPVANARSEILATQNKFVNANTSGSAVTHAWLETLRSETTILETLAL